MADKTSVLVNISDMIDLAIGTPELFTYTWTGFGLVPGVLRPWGDEDAPGLDHVGVVDFNMLQTVLHCLAQQQRILDKNVELRGSVASLPITSGADRDNVQTIAISEYIVDTDDDKKGAPKKKEKVDRSPETDDTILVVERIKKSESPRSPVRGVSPSTPRSSIAAKRPSTAPAKDATSHGPRAVSSTERLSLVTISKFNILENQVEDLKNRVYGSMPKNEDILEEVRSQTNLKAITDMWTSLNVSSRLEAAEAGIAKLSSLVQDLISETTGLQDIMDKRGGSKTTVAPGPTSIAALLPKDTSATAAVITPASAAAIAPTSAAAIAPTSAAAIALTSASAIAPISTASVVAAQAWSGPPPATKEDLVAMLAHLQHLRDDLDHLSNTFYGAMKELNTKVDPPPPPPPALPTIVPSVVAPQIGSSAVSQSRMAPSTGADAGAGADGGAGSGASTGASAGAGAVSNQYSTLPAGIVDKINALEQQLKKCCESIDKKTGEVQDQINALQDQLEYLVKLNTNNAPTATAEQSQDLSSAKLSPDLIKDLQCLMQLFQTVQDMQDQLHQVHETALQLAAEKEDRQHHVDVLLEQIELLKIVKLDREDMVEAMAEKADLRMLARKVSHDQFEMACDDLSRGLEHALGKLNMQEALWQQALDDIQREIETKLDKMELSPVKDFFNNKLKQLQENLKQMASLRREAEAAGTKRRLLRDVNCISCDAKVVMNTEANSAIPMSKPLPAQFSMKPYLSYELDAIRKSQANNVPQRNMHDWETIDKQMAHHKPPQKVRSDTDRHLCNRYCGGSHTVTTPAQRVTRLGHFIKQWGPDVLPLSSGFAAGDDGRMYRVSQIEGVIVGPGGSVEAPCTPKSPKKKESKLIEKTTVISNECRCLEGELPSKSNH